MDEVIRIGTRGSKLALWQAYHVQELLQKEGLQTEIITIETKGDKIQNVSIAKIGSKGVFTEEIEDQLAAGNIDIAVHSAKDMQSTLPIGFELIAFTEREQVHDVVVSKNASVDLKNENLVIGTSSTRRKALLKHFYPHVKTIEIRGNLQSRMRKMEEGQCDGLMLAYAGVFRMNYHRHIKAHMTLEEFIPAVGQGSVAIEAATSLAPAKKKLIRKLVNHTATEKRLKAERAFLKTIEGGCSIPVFALADLKDNTLTLEGGIISLDGQEMVRTSVTGSQDQGEALGVRLGNEVLDLGGAEILEQIKATLGRE